MNANNNEIIAAVEFVKSKPKGKRVNKKEKKIVVEEEVVEEVVEVVEPEEVVVEEVVVEEVVEEEEEEEDDIDRQIRLLQEKKKQRQIKKNLEGNSDKYLTHIKNMLNRKIESNEKVLAEINAENIVFRKQLDDLEGITDTTKIMNYLASNFPEAMNALTADVRGVKKREIKYKDSKWYNGETKTKKNRDECMKMLPDRLRLRANVKGCEIQVIWLKDEKVFYERASEQRFKTLGQVEKEFLKRRQEATPTKCWGLNAWSAFKAYAEDNGKMKSIENIHDDNWLENIAEEDLQPYLDTDDI